MLIYIVKNTINNNIYIGQTIQKLSKRWKNHQSKGNALYCAIKKYGIDNFSIEQLDVANSLDELNTKEAYWINKLNSIAPSGYNLRLGGNNGGKHSKETCEKISKAGIGRKRSEKTKKAISIANSGSNNPMYGKSPNFGKKCSEETKKKISEANKKISKEIVNRISRLNTGKKRSLETRLKLSKSHNKSLICDQTGVIFENLAAAAIEYSTSSSTIRRILIGKIKSINGITFKYFKTKE